MSDEKRINHKVAQMLGHRMAGVEKTLDLIDLLEPEHNLRLTLTLRVESDVRWLDVVVDQADDTWLSEWQRTAFKDQMRVLVERLLAIHTIKEN